MNLEPLAASNGAIDSSIDSLKAVYAVLLTLSLGEAFSQIVEKPEGAKGGGKEIRWDRLLNLAPFLLLIIPFIHGMDRYFFDAYKTAKRPADYGSGLLLDCIIFTLEGGLFFVLARSLSQDKWRRFYSTIIALLILDCAWGLTVWHRDPAWRPDLSTLEVWVLLDVFFFLIVLVITFVPLCLFSFIPLNVFRRGIKYERKAWVRSGLCLVAILVRTVLDYKYSWKFYFPS